MEAEKRTDGPVLFSAFVYINIDIKYVVISPITKLYFYKFYISPYENGKTSVIINDV